MLTQFEQYAAKENKGKSSSKSHLLNMRKLSVF